VVSLFLLFFSATMSVPVVLAARVLRSRKTVYVALDYESPEVSWPPVLAKLQEYVDGYGFGLHVHLEHNVIRHSAFELLPSSILSDKESMSYYIPARPGNQVYIYLNGTRSSRRREKSSPDVQLVLLTTRAMVPSRRSGMSSFHSPQPSRGPLVWLSAGRGPSFRAAL
jgi:hypothetical protein